MQPGEAPGVPTLSRVAVPGRGGIPVPSRRPTSAAPTMARPVPAPSSVPVRASARPSTGVAPAGGRHVSAADVAPPGKLATWTVRRGIASHMGAGYAAGYLALPQGRGVRARICGSMGCVSMTSTDAGPAKSMQRPPYNRVADLSRDAFRVVCGPPSRGLCPVVVTILGH